MKSKSLICAMTALLATNLFAGDHSINIIGRAGWAYKDHDSQATANSSAFDIDFLRTTFAGIITPSVQYFFTTDLLAANGNNDVTDGTSGFIDEAFVTKIFPTGTGITFGKKAVLIGGREADYVDFDRYSVSSFVGNVPDNQVGLTLTQEWAGNTFIAQYFNGNKDRAQTDANGDAVNAQTKYGYSVGWYGDLLDGKIKPIVAYTVIPEATGAASTAEPRVNAGDDTFLGAGLQFNFGNLAIETDYGLLTEKEAAGTTSERLDLKTTSLVGLVRHSNERCSHFVKLIKDTLKSESTKTAERTAYDVGVEFKESKDDLIRYHAVYSGSSVKSYAEGVTTKTSPKSIMVGLKFDASILK